MNVERFFDACLVADNELATPLPEALCGAVTYGVAKFGATADVPILRAGGLNAVVGANDPRYPAGADVIDLQLAPDDLLRGLKLSHDRWWPLSGQPRADGKKVVVHIEAREFGSLARGMSRLARAFPAAVFVIDPFQAGKESKWQAGVCLADENNIWLTTRGLFAAVRIWPDQSEREALHFVAGEVGAGKLLFASGLTPEGLSAQRPTPAEWLGSIEFLDDAQRELILWRNSCEALNIELA
jgi:hypothetical protein